MVRADTAPARLELRIAMNGHFPPFTMLDGAHHFGGIFVDELALVGRHAGIDFSFFDLPWARAQVMVQSGAMDGFCTIETPDRQDYALFAPTPLYNEGIVVIGRNDDPATKNILSLGDLDGLRVGEALGNDWFKSLLQGRNVTWVNDLPNLLAMIAANRLDLTIVGDRVGAIALAQHPDRSRLRAQKLTSLPDDGGFRIGVRKSLADAPAIIARIDQAIRETRSAFPEIQERYLAMVER